MAGNFYTGLVLPTDWNFTTATAQHSTGVNEVFEKKLVKVTNSAIQISANASSYQYQIIDLQGNIIKEKNNVQVDSIIHFSEFKPSVYILTLSNNGQVIQRKFVVQ